MCSKSDTKKVEILQDRSLCFIYRKCESDYKSLLNLVQRSSLYMDRLRTIVTEVYKAINGMSPEYLQDLFVIKVNVHDFCGSLCGLLQYFLEKKLPSDYPCKSHD